MSIDFVPVLVVPVLVAVPVLLAIDSFVVDSFAAYSSAEPELEPVLVAC